MPACCAFVHNLSKEKKHTHTQPDSQNGYYNEVDNDHDDAVHIAEMMSS